MRGVGGGGPRWIRRLYQGHVRSSTQIPQGIRIRNQGVGSTGNGSTEVGLSKGRRRDSRCWRLDSWIDGPGPRVDRHVKLEGDDQEEKTTNTRP